MGEQSGPTPAARQAVQCTACGYDITGAAPGGACPECGAPVYGFEAHEARSLSIRGLTLVLWGLPVAALAIIPPPMVNLFVSTGDRSAALVPIYIVTRYLLYPPALLTLVGLILAARYWPRTLPVRRLCLWSLGASFALLAYWAVRSTIMFGHTNSHLGFDAQAQPIMSHLDGALLATWFAYAGLIVAPLTAGLAFAWLTQACSRAGLAARNSPIVVFVVVFVTVGSVLWIPAIGEPLSRSWQAAAASSRASQGMPRPSMPGRGVQAAAPPPAVELPWHAQWVNPASIKFMTRIGYTLIFLLATAAWLTILRLRERMQLIAARSASMPATDLPR